VRCLSSLSHLHSAQILEQQKKEKGADTMLLPTEPSSNATNNAEDVDEKIIELGLTARRKMSTKTGK
jgi:hypothetical protein